MAAPQQLLQQRPGVLLGNPQLLSYPRQPLAACSSSRSSRSSSQRRHAGTRVVAAAAAVAAPPPAAGIAAAWPSRFCGGVANFTAQQALPTMPQLPATPGRSRRFGGGSGGGGGGGSLGLSGGRQQQQQRHQRGAALVTASIAGSGVALLSGVASAVSAATGAPWDVTCALMAAVAAYAWVKVFDWLAASGALEQKLSRKLVHSTAGPLFMLTWPLFSDAPSARWLAALVPALNMVRLVAVGNGLLRDDGLVKSVSRDGDRGELLKGPLYYCLVIVSVTLLFWRASPAGVIAVSMMCGGDGLADIVGRRLGRGNPLPWNAAKSWAGSAAMLFGGIAMSSGFFALFCSLGYFECWSLRVLLPYLCAVCGAGALVESLPINSWLDDNLSVPLVALAASMVALPLAAAAHAGCATAHAPAGVLQMLKL